MDAYEPSTYGDRIAPVYDDLYGHMFDADATADFLAALAPEGRALELGIGTGRIALPLLERGLQVHGLDASEAMVARLRAKPGAEHIRVTLGDFARFDLGVRFDLVYVVFNTFFALPTQQDQVTCFSCIARHLAAHGVFAMESFVPDVARYDRHQRVHVNEVLGGRVQLEASRHDPVHQRISSQHVVFDEGGVRMFPIELRYAYPSELDLMARLAGLTLRDRYGGFGGEAFTSDSKVHVSVYVRG